MYRDRTLEEEMRAERQAGLESGPETSAVPEDSEQDTTGEAKIHQLVVNRVILRYCLHFSRYVCRGIATDARYVFTPETRMQAVDARDAENLLNKLYTSGCCGGARTSVPVFEIIP